VVHQFGDGAYVTVQDLVAAQAERGVYHRGLY
jgi:hypothetical protein